MTGDELKKYKQQIEALKRDFHKDSPENIENKGFSDKEVQKNKISTSVNSTKNVISQSKETITQSTQKIDQTKNRFLDALREADKPKKNLSSSSQNIESSKVESKIVSKEPMIESSTLKKETLATTKQSISEQKPITKETVNTFEKKPVQEHKIENVKKEISKPTENKVSEVKKEVKTVSKIDNSINDVPPINRRDEEEESKFPFLKILLLLLFLILIGFIAYYFYNKIKTKSDLKAKKELVEKAYNDSILLYQNNLDSQDDLNDDNALISDTIYNITSMNPEGYYAIIGSYSELKNASIMKTKQKTHFTSYIFEENPIRVGLKISEDESEIYNDLESVREYYPDAWLIFNKN